MVLANPNHNHDEETQALRWNKLYAPHFHLLVCAHALMRVHLSNT